MRRAVVFGAVLAVVAGAGVQAYLKIGTDVGGTIVGIRWATQPVRYFITDRGVPGVSPGALSDAVARAFGTWSAASGSAIRPEFSGFVHAEPSASDGLSVIGFELRPDLERVLGTTSFTLDDATGDILEADILLNAAFDWSVAANGEPGRHDAESIAVHEIGHLLGLGHSALGETELLDDGGRRVIAKGAVMFPIAFPSGVTRDRELQPDDTAGVLDIYRTTAFNRERGSLSGRVTLNGRGVFGAHVVACNVSTGALHASFSLSSDGTYVIAGLEPGVYVLRAEPLDDADVESFFDEDAFVEVDFQPAYATSLGVVPSGGRAGTRVDIAVQPK